MPTIVPSTPEAPCEQVEPVCFCDCDCGCPEDNSTAAFGDCESYSSEETSVRFVNGEIRIDATDVEASGFGVRWGHTRVYSNQLSDDADIGQGYNWLVFQWPYLVQDGDTIVVVRGTLGSLWFDLVETAYVGRYAAKSTLVYDSENHIYVLTLPSGVQIIFHDFVQTTYPQGLFFQQVQPGGLIIKVDSYTGSDRIAIVKRVGSSDGQTLTEVFVYEYDANGRLISVRLRRQYPCAGGGWTDVRRALYDYYPDASDFGSEGDLRTVRFQVPTETDWADTETTLYRYWISSDLPGFVHGLKFVVLPLDFARMVGASIDPLTADDEVIETYASHYFEYDSNHRVVLSSVEGGTETTTFAYTEGETSDENGDIWAMKTVETLPDESVKIVYTNSVGQYLLIDRNDGGASWIDAYERADWQETWHAQPSAVTGYSDSSSELDVTYNTDLGFIKLTEYYADKSDGGAPGYVASRSIQQGSEGTPVLLQDYTYTSVIVGATEVFSVETQTIYRNDNATGGIETSYAYTYFSGTTQIQQITATLPTVTTAQNGPDAAATRVTVLDLYGRAIWFEDEEGFLTYRQHSLSTGAVVKMIQDVDTTLTGEFSELPFGWETPAGGGLNLIMIYEVDNVGRTTKRTSPNGRVDYMVFNDVAHETRVYPGWNTDTNAPTGPTQVSRQDRLRNYGETLTMSVAPNIDASGRPSGTEAIADLQSLSRGLFNQVGQLVEQDQYFDLTKLEYSTEPTIGVAGTNYYATTYTFDNRNRVVRTLTPQATIQRTVYDFLNRTLSQWTGTNDTPASGDWAPDNNTSPSNMVQITAYEFDDGGVGDGNLTTSTQIPSGVFGSGDDRVTKTWFDWRNRGMATKSGVQATETDPVHRPIIYLDFDNLNRVVMTRRYDGDGVTITVTDGVPEPPTSTLLRAQSETLYDERGQVYRTLTYSVDPGDGTVSATALTTNNYYDYRGNLIETSPPGGLVSKSAYDGVGRMTVGYSTDGGGGTSWNAASSVESDQVLEQTETTYDGNGNVMTTTLRQRFDDETADGALGTPDSGVLARVYYSGNYYDLADRITDSVNVGTNGGDTWTQPDEVPERDDATLVNSTTYDAAGRVMDGTDPKGLVLRSLYDLAGRTLTTIEDYTDGTPTDDTNKTTNFTYNSAGTTSLSALLSGGSDHQTTAWIYGVTTGGGSEVDSNEIAATTQYPDPSSGDPSSSEEEVLTVNSLGQTITSTDRNDNEHTYIYDVLGRLVSDAVVQGSGVDDAVLRYETAYDTQGNAYLFTAYNATSGGDVVNQVQREFNGLGQLITEYQEHSGEVNTGSTLKVQYAYSEMAGDANHSRLTTMTYPNGRDLNYNYDTGLDNTISRLTSMIDDDDTTVLEGYAYLGVGTVVERAHPEPDLTLTYIKLSGESDGDAGDKYIGLDRFGRVVDQRWIDGSDDDVDRYQYTYDRNNNRLTRTNVLNSDFNETYTYDDLNQISTYDRGSGALTQSWSYDAVGNWASVTTGLTTQTRTHNRLNEITSISGGATTPTYDNNGNTTKTDINYRYKYDAWNRIAEVRNASNIVVRVYGYDGLSRRITGEWDLYYTANWQQIEERRSGTARIHYVWSPVYIDCLVLCDRMFSTPAERIYATQDANYNVTALVNRSGAVIQRHVYTPFGVLTLLDASWSTGDPGTYKWLVFFQGGFLSEGLYYFRNRDCSPTLGRWLATDLIKMRSGHINLYIYQRNNPVNRIDPRGLKCKITAHKRSSLGIGPNHWGLTIETDVQGLPNNFYLDAGPDAGAAAGLISATDVVFKYVSPPDGRYTDVPNISWDVADKTCLCIWNYSVAFNNSKTTYEPRSANSNWGLRCALEHCGLSIIWNDDGPPVGWDGEECKSWNYNPSPSHPAASCYICTKWGPKKCP